MRLKELLIILIIRRQELFGALELRRPALQQRLLLNMMADKVGITPWEIRYRNAIRPGEVLPNGQIVDDSTGLVETLEAVKEKYDAALEAGKAVGLGCAMKNAGVGVGIPDTGRVKLIFEEDRKLHIYSGASCIGQGLGTVLTQMIVTNTDIKREDIVYERSNTWISPDSGTTSGSRQTLITGEACRRACEKLMEDKRGGKHSRGNDRQGLLRRISCKNRPSWSRCAKSGISCGIWLCYPGLYPGFQNR